MAQWRAVRSQSRNADSHVDQVIQGLRNLQGDIEEHFGRKLSGLNWLEVGYGQAPLTLAYFAAIGNRATGIDLDVVPPSTTDVTGWLRLLRKNGAKRFLKSAFRDASGVNRAFKRAFVRRMGIRKWPELTTLWMDALVMQFPGESFDFVYSFDVFEHIPEPEKAMREIARVLRPGGSVSVTFVTYTYHNALHDLRVITHASNAPEPWAHLMPELKDSVLQGAYVNCIRLADWRARFEAEWPGATVLLHASPEEKVRKLADFRSRGWLGDFTDEELLAEHVTVRWTKPAVM